ncbi:GNAT family N-acetyltransferase [Actinoplanes sp. NPDC000266]
MGTFDAPASGQVGNAWSDAMRQLAGHVPGGWYTREADVGAFVTGAPLAPLNAAYSFAGEPDLSSLDRVVGEVVAFGRPWSIIVPVETAGAVADLAVRRGADRRHAIEVMTCAAGDALLDADRVHRERVHPIGAELGTIYAETLATSFETAGDAFDLLASGDVLDAGGFTGYLAHGSGRPVATGLGVSSGDMVGIYNIGVVPTLRRRGLGRAITSRVLEDGFAGGAGTAYLLSSASGKPMYQAMGFHVTQTWTQFTCA